MFYENALQLEGAEPIVGTLENIVCPPNISEVTVGVAVGYIAGSGFSGSPALVSSVSLTGNAFSSSKINSRQTFYEGLAKCRQYFSTASVGWSRQPSTARHWSVVSNSLSSHLHG